MAQHLENKVSGGDFAAVDLVTSSVRTDGRSAEIDVETRTSGNLDMGRALLGRRPKDHTKTDCLTLYFHYAHGRAPYFYNRFSARLVGSFENRVFDQPVKVWRLTTSHTTSENYKITIGDGRADVVCGGAPRTWEMAYAWFHLGLKESRHKALEIAPLSTEEPTSSSRDYGGLVSPYRNITFGHFRIVSIKNKSPQNKLSPMKS